MAGPREEFFVRLWFLKGRSLGGVVVDPREEFGCGGG